MRGRGGTTKGDQSAIVEFLFCPVARDPDGIGLNPASSTGSQRERLRGTYCDDSLCRRGGVLVVDTVSLVSPAPHDLPANIGWGAAYSSHIRPCTALSSSSVIRWPVVKYPARTVSSESEVVWDYGGCLIPALILASISTLESAGIHDSGSSTRSRMGILPGALSAIPAWAAAQRVCTHPCPTMASCFMLNIVAR